MPEPLSTQPVGPSEEAIRAAFDASSAGWSPALRAAYPIIRADVIAEVVEWWREPSPLTYGLDRNAIARLIEQRFGGHDGD